MSDPLDPLPLLRPYQRDALRSLFIEVDYEALAARAAALYTDQPGSFKAALGKLLPPPDPGDPPRFEESYPEEAGYLQHRYELFGKHGLPEKWVMPRVDQERNAPCDCRSGKKAKKCCNLVPDVQDGSWSLLVTSLNNEPVRLYLDSNGVRVDYF